jgi:signal transduction histidine kinase
LQLLSQRLVEVQEDERRAIASELHDSVGQSLAALNLNLTIIYSQLSTFVNEEVKGRFTDCISLVTEIIALVRDVMSNLRPTVLDDYGLEAALQLTLEKFKSRSGVGIQFNKSAMEIPRLGSAIEMTLLRITQEGLMNVLRHAQADQVDLSLQIEEQVVRLTLQDNGTGIRSWQAANRPGSHGMTIMRERAEAVGGKFNVSSTADKGTRIEVSIPIRNTTVEESNQ